eukprot:Skav207451  [mRNA]  locus=scaffold3545:36820:41324:+ [translate_table: standard]
MREPIPVTYSIGGLLATTAAEPLFMSSGLYLFALLVLVPMGTAGIKSNISNFGADQYDMSDPDQVAAQEQFFQWFYMAINDYGYFAAYFIASMCMLFAVVSFFCVRGRYRALARHGSVPTPDDVTKADQLQP